MVILDHRLWWKCQRFWQVQRQYSDKNRDRGNAQIAFLLQIETTNWKENSHRLYFTSNWDHRLWGKCSNCDENAQIVFLPQIETTDCDENAQIVFFTSNWDHRLWWKCTHCDENAQIVFLPRIETTDCEENAQTVRKIHRLWGKCTDCILTIQSVHFYHRLWSQFEEKYNLYIFLTFCGLNSR
jgi:hypothetical protein